MIRVPYPRQLNQPVRYFKFFTIMDLIVIAGCTLVVPQMLGFLYYLAALLVYVIYHALFTIGKPEGNGSHYFQQLIRPDKFNVGRKPFYKAVIRPEGKS